MLQQAFKAFFFLFLPPKCVTQAIVVAGYLSKTKQGSIKLRAMSIVDPVSNDREAKADKRRRKKHYNA